MTDRLCTRQVCFILTAYSAAGKLIMMPAQLAYYAKNDLWFTLLIIYLLQTAVVWAVAYACSKTQKTAFGLIRSAFGSVAEKVFLWLFAAFFLMAALMPAIEQKLFVHDVFYDTVPDLIVFLPFFAFSLYVGAKGLNNAGRTADIVLPLLAAAFIAIFIMGAAESNFSWLLPVLKQPVKNIAGGAGYCLYYFTDGAVMLALMGRFKYKKGDCTRITLSYAAGALAVILFCMVFYSVFSSLSADEYFAVSKVAIFFPALSVTGRLDLLAVYVIDIAVIFGISLYVQLFVYCLYCALGGRVKRVYLSVAANILLLAAVIIFNDNYLALQQVYGRYLWGVYLLFAFVLPPLLWALKAKRGAWNEG